METQPLDLNEDPVAIGSATSVEEILGALARRGCSNLTSSIDLTACSDFPCAQGGFCDVYRGVLDDGTGIAIKALRIYDDSERVKVLKRAARELYHWSKFRHCNVLPLLGLTVFRRHISLVSEWMENGSLMSYIKRRPDANRTKLCMGICAGLCYIHTNDTVHGDLKAANIMVSSNGTALVADFGNAQLRHFTLKFTGTSKLDLSVPWTAPELLVPGGKLQGSKEGDVYAFGMTVLEVLTGKTPFHGLKHSQILCLVSRGEKVPPRPDIGIRDDLWIVLKLCWNRDPTKRPRIEIIRDGLRALFRPPFDTWSIHETTSQSQGSRKRVVGEDEGDERQRRVRSKFGEKNKQYYNSEGEYESETEEAEEIGERGEGAEKYRAESPTLICGLAELCIKKHYTSRTEYQHYCARDSCRAWYHRECLIDAGLELELEPTDDRLMLMLQGTPGFEWVGIGNEDCRFFEQVKIALPYIQGIVSCAQHSVLRGKGYDVVDTYKQIKEARTVLYEACKDDLWPSEDEIEAFARWPAPTEPIYKCKKCHLAI